jgi:hypothetical protein
MLACGVPLILFWPRDRSSFSSRTTFRVLHLYAASTRSPTIGIKPTAKSTMMLNCMRILVEEDSSGLTEQHVRYTIRAKKRSMMSPMLQWSQYEVQRKGWDHLRRNQSKDSSPAEPGAKEAAQAQVDSICSALRLGQDLLLFWCQAGRKGSLSLLGAFVHAAKASGRDGLKVWVLRLNQY